MFNWLASVLIVYLLVNVLREPQSMNPETRAFPEQSHIPFMHDVLAAFGIEIPASQLNLTLVLALAASYCVWLLIYRSRLGYAIRVVGSNPTAAVYAGISPARIIIIAMVLSGALAGGLAVNELMGYQHRLLLEFTSGYGFVGIAVALMGRAHPVGIILASLLFGILYQGGAELAFEQPAITRDMVVVIGGIIILFAGALDGLFRRLVAHLFDASEAGEGLSHGSRHSRHHLRLGPAALDPASRRLPCRPLVGALRRGRYRPRRQDAGGGLRGAAAAYAFGSAWIGLLAGIAASVAFALVHGFASISQRGNQIVSGVAINMLAAGLTAIVGNAWYGQGGRTPPLEGDAALRRRALRPFGARLLVLLAVPLTWFVLGRTRFGLRLRAVGENPAAVDTAGISVTGLRYAAVIIAGVLCGLARRLSVGRPVGRLPAQHDRRQGLHRARGPDLRQVARLAGARRLLPVRPARRRRHPAAGHLAARESARCRCRRSRRCPIS